MSKQEHLFIHFLEQLQKQSNLYLLDKVFMLMLDMFFKPVSIQIYRYFPQYKSQDRYLRLMYKHKQIDVDRKLLDQCCRRKKTVLLAQQVFYHLLLPQRLNGETFFILYVKLLKTHWLDELWKRASKVYIVRWKQLYQKKDPLTGLWPRHQLQQDILCIPHVEKQRVVNKRKKHYGLCLALLDLDYFAKINEYYGEIWGDKTLLAFSRFMMQSFRENDLLFHYGGEAFVVVLREADLEVAEKALLRFCQAVEEHTFPNAITLTVSIAFTVLEDIPIEKLLKRVNDTLYIAKKQGRNRVCCYEYLIQSGELSDQQSITQLIVDDIYL